MKRIQPTTAPLTADQLPIYGIGWQEVFSVGTPDNDRPVLVWNSAEKQAYIAFFDADESCWISMAGGAPLVYSEVTHWLDYQAPKGFSE